MQFSLRPNGTDRYIYRQVITQQFYHRVMAPSTPDDVWLDGGANIGTFTVATATWRPEVKQVVAIEPDPTNFDLLSQHVHANSVHNAVLIQGAIVGGPTAPVFLHQHATRQADHSLYGKGPGITVPGLNINELIERFGITHIKLDVEGAEYDILQAISPENWKGIRELLVEYHKYRGLLTLEELRNLELTLDYRLGNLTIFAQKRELIWFRAGRTRL